MTDPIKTALDALKSVFCGPEGNVCIDGSDEDRAIIQRSLAALEGLEKAEPFCHHDGVSIVHSEFKDDSDVFPLYRHPAPVQPEPKVWAYSTEDGERIVAAKTYEGAMRDGGAMASSMRPYTVPLFTHPAPVQAEPFNGQTQLQIAYVMGLRDAAPQPAAQVVGMEPTNGWFFEQLAESKTLLAVEPDGTRHVVKNGRMDSVDGAKLLSRMVEALAAPSKSALKPDHFPDAGEMVAAEPTPARQHITDGTPCWCEPELHHKDPETGAEVWVHRGIQ